MKTKILIIALMLMGTSSFGQLLGDPCWEPKIKKPVYMFDDIFEDLYPEFSIYNQLTLQGVGGVFVPENLGKMTLIPKAVARKED